MDEVKLALELNRVVHNECKDVPHDIGLRLLEVVKKHIGEQLNLPPVIKSVCEHKRIRENIAGGRFDECLDCGKTWG
jgi:hypothetical protein